MRKKKRLFYVLHHVCNVDRVRGDIHGYWYVQSLIPFSLTIQLITPKLGILEFAKWQNFCTLICIGKKWYNKVMYSNDFLQALTPSIFTLK